MATEPKDPEASHGGVWAEYRFHVLAQLERLGKDIEKTRDTALREFDRLQKEFEKLQEQAEKQREATTQLRLKASFWGGIAGALGYMINFVVDKLFRK